MKEKYNKNHKTVLDELLLGEKHLKAGKMFGYPAYYAGKKLSICHYQQGVGVKLPEKVASTLVERDQHICPFQPMGRAKMKEWIQINLEDSEEYRAYADIFRQSIYFVLEQQSIKS
jgi:predicted DNA-binding protein (MmcQ/YjbR family)